MSTQISSLFEILPITPNPVISITQFNPNSKLEQFFKQSNIKNIIIANQNFKTIEMKSIQTIISLLLASNFQKMTSIDWTQVYHLPDFRDFYQYDDHTKKTMIASIWNYILTQKVSDFSYLFQRLTDYIFLEEKQLKKISIHWLFKREIMIDVLSRKSPNWTKETQNLLAVYLLDNPAKLIMKSARKHKKMPWHILETDGVFCSIEVSKTFLPYTVDVLDQQGIDNQDLQWLYQCLKECDSHQELVRRLGIDLLLKLPSTYDDTLKIKDLINWYKKHFDRKKEHSLWYGLDSNSKLRLLKWFGGLNFQDFQKLVKQIIDGLTNDPELNLSNQTRETRDMEIRHLKRRSTFWSHYQESILSMKIILPEKSYHLAQNYQMTDIQKNKNPIDPEICLLEFQKYIVAIIMRGSATKTLIYENNDQRYTQLFKGNFTKNDLLNNPAYAPKKSQEHFKYWQNILQIYLYDLGIYVDQGIKEFVFNPEDPKSRRVLKNGKLPDLTIDQHKELQQIINNHNNKELKKYQR